MGIGAGIFLLIVGLILVLDVFKIPNDALSFVKVDTLGWILIAGGVLALVLGLVMNNQRRKTTYVEERRDVGP